MGLLNRLLARKVDPAFFEAAKKGDMDAIRTFLDRGVSPNARDDHDDTALSWAACHGHSDLCRLLIERGADMEARQYEGATPLILAADRGHEETVRGSRGGCERPASERRDGGDGVRGARRSSLDRPILG